VSSSVWARARPLVGATILVVLLWRVGTGPFLDGLRLVDARSLAAATVIAALTTACCAWRWSVVAHGLGVPVGVREAMSAYYLSQFLNTTLPGGVLGDVDRGLRHGRRSGNAGLGLRAVAWERLSGQAVQVVLALALLLWLPSPVQGSIPAVALVVVGGVAVAVLVGRALPSRFARAAAGDVRRAVLAPRAWPVVLLASGLAVVGHAMTFVIAARTAGARASLGELLPLALLVLLAMGVPASIAGWGPREGAAAWAFAGAGLGASQGVAVAVVYGVMVLVASLPGAVVLLARRPHLLGAGRG
jgi:uncharacterized membrane protein YbhN (UPF0104 family)